MKQVINLGVDEYIIGYELRTGQVVDSITLWSNKRGLGTFGGTGGKSQEKKLGMPGESLVDIKIVGVKFKGITNVQNMVNAEWAPFGKQQIWTDGEW